MTPVEIKEKWAKLSPHERDAWVAEKVTKWDRSHDVIECEDMWYTYCRRCGEEFRDGGCILRFVDDNSYEYVKNCTVPPHYSSDISGAWEVVKKILSDWGPNSKTEDWRRIGEPIGFRLECHTEDSGEEWLCVLPSVTSTPPYEEMSDLIYVKAPTAPEAICLAALIVVEGCP